MEYRRLGRTGLMVSELCLMQEGVTAPIIGASRLEQLEDNLGAASWQLSGEQAARLSEASAIEDVLPLPHDQGDATGLAPGPSGRLISWTATLSTCA